MPAGPELRRRILAGETVVGTFLNMGSPTATEICGRAGFDWLLIDMEHGTGTDADLLAMLYAARATDTPVIVRPEVASRSRVGRALDMGADGVMVPQILDADEAQEVASWVRFQPVGKRGVALFTRGLAFGEGGHAGPKTRNEQVVLMAQVETEQAVADAAQMAALDAVDVLFVGPTDLTHALGVPGQIDHPSYRDAITSVAKDAKAHGKATGVLLWKAEDARFYAELGFTVFAISSEGALLDRSVRAALAATRESARAG
jgi:2-keto-3-deoxy-L-rhamnonate aldolase RhmA